MANYWYMRKVYREKIPMSSADMDKEPLEEVNYNFAMWRLEAKRERKEQKRQERNNSNG